MFNIKHGRKYIGVNHSEDGTWFDEIPASLVEKYCQVILKDDQRLNNSTLVRFIGLDDNKTDHYALFDENNNHIYDWHSCIVHDVQKCTKEIEHTKYIEEWILMMLYKNDEYKVIGNQTYTEHVLKFYDDMFKMKLIIKSPEAEKFLKDLKEGRLV